MRLHNVLILCAGRGTRYAGKGNEIPKCLISLGNELVIDRQIRLLRENGIENINVVVGIHPKYHIAKQIKDHLKDSKINIIEVDMTKVRQYPNEVYTILNCQHLLNNTLILLGDVVFDDRVVKQMLNESVDNVTFIRGKDKRPEVFGILTRNNFMEGYKSRWAYWSKFHWQVKIRDLIPIINPKIFIPQGLIYDIDYPWDLDNIMERFHETGKTL